MNDLWPILLVLQLPVRFCGAAVENLFHPIRYRLCQDTPDDFRRSTAEDQRHRQRQTLLQSNEETKGGPFKH